MNVRRLSGGAACGDVFHHRRQLFQYTTRSVSFFHRQDAMLPSMNVYCNCFCEVDAVAARRIGHFFPRAYHFCLVWVWFPRVSEVVHDPSVLVSSFLPTPSQFAATCEQIARQDVVGMAPVLQCEAISQYARSDMDSASGVWHDHRRE